MFQGDIDDMIVIFFIYSDSLYTNLDVKEEKNYKNKKMRSACVFPLFFRPIALFDHGKQHSTQ